MDYFTLFGLPVCYELDPQQLASQYQQLQRQFHPDRYAVAPEREKRLALQQAAIINHAYNTLRHPLERAVYLISLHGVETDNEHNTLNDNVFLLEQMALREELEQVEQQQELAALVAFYARIDKITHSYHQKLKQQLASDDWELAAESVRKLRFFAKLIQQTEQLEQQLLDL